MIHFGLAFFRNAAGQTVQDRWRQKQFIGLTNDEQVAVVGYGRSYVSVLEVQEIVPGCGRLWVVDLFRPEAGRFLLIDQAAAAAVSRFTLLFSWFLPLPHYTRVSGVTAVHVPRETFEPWKDRLLRSFKSARVRHSDLTREIYLAGTFYLQIERLTDVGREWQKSMLQNMDFCRAVGRFKFSVPYRGIAEVLAGKPDLEVVEPKAGDGFDKPLQQFIWLRRGESKALEKEMIASFRHADSDGSVGGLATLRLYPDRVVLEAFSRQKYDFARKLLERWFGTRLRLETESIEDVAKMLAEKGSSDDLQSRPSTEASPLAVFASGSKTPEARRTTESRPIPPGQAREALQAFYEATYRKFPDEPVPMLGNATPREASRRKALRSKLIELMKIHIQGVEETNRREGTQISLDGLLEELGIPELRAGR